MLSTDYLNLIKYFVYGDDVNEMFGDNDSICGKEVDAYQVAKEDKSQSAPSHQSLQTKTKTFKNFTKKQEVPDLLILIKTFRSFSISLNHSI